MVENKELLSKLMSDNSNKIDSLWATGESDTDKMMSISRVVQVRYRFYAVGVLLIILLVFFRLILPSIDKYNDEKASLLRADNELQEIQMKEDQYYQNIWNLEDIQVKSSQIVSCVNEMQGCNELSGEIRDHFWLARSYLLTYNIDGNKMEVNERKIIENIDMFLLKDNPFANNSAVNWTLSKISIWDKTLENWLYSVPIQLDITFEDKNSLLSFLNNVEKYIPEEEENRILYKIDKITYDIVNSDEPQDTTIYMNLYYYNE